MFLIDNYQQEFLHRINIPLGMDPKEFLKTFTTNEHNEGTDTETSSTPIYPLVKYIHTQKPVISEEMIKDFNEYFEVINMILAKLIGLVYL